MDIEAVLPFAFPYGMGVPNQKRRTAVSKSEIIRRYVRLAMPQFMTPDVILVLHHIFTRQLSFNTGVMTCRNTFNSSNEFTKKINSLHLILKQPKSNQIRVQMRMSTPLWNPFKHHVNLWDTQQKRPKQQGDVNLQWLTFSVWTVCFSLLLPMMSAASEWDSMLIQIKR